MTTHTAQGSSLGNFARWQAIYAGLGIVTIPCSPNKKPLVKNPTKFGLPASNAMSKRFPDASALGFYAGSRNKVTVLDVDTTDERVLRDAMDRHGVSPLIVRTASGKFHGYYRYCGEHRKIRPWAEQQLPIDVLGAGLCIAPPSIASKGRYEIIEGRLDDLDRLPIMRGLDDRFYSRGKAASPLPTSRGPKPWAEMRDNDGRNNALFRRLGREAHDCDDFEQLIGCAHTLNDKFGEPMGNDEVSSVAASAWKMTIEGHNRFGQHGAWLSVADVDAIVGEPYELALLAWLKAHNQPHSMFMIADGLAGVLRWPRRPFKDARRRLIQKGRIIPLNQPRPGQPVLYRWGVYAGERRSMQEREGLCRREKVYAGERTKGERVSVEDSLPILVGDAGR